MFSGPPLPLSHDFPLRQLVTVIGCSDNVGVWLRDARLQRLLITAAGRCISVLLGDDLGALLRCCSRLVVRSHSQAMVLEAEALIRWRVLQVVTGTPYLPCVERLRELFPQAEIDDVGFQVPTHRSPPEEVLAECLTHGIRVTASRITYRDPGVRDKPVTPAGSTHTPRLPRHFLSVDSM